MNIIWRLWIAFGQFCLSGGLRLMHPSQFLIAVRTGCGTRFSPVAFRAGCGDDCLPWSRGGTERRLLEDGNAE